LIEYGPPGSERLSSGELVPQPNRSGTSTIDTADRVTFMERPNRIPGTRR